MWLGHVGFCGFVVNRMPYIFICTCNYFYSLKEKKCSIVFFAFKWALTDQFCHIACQSMINTDLSVEYSI